MTGLKEDIRKNKITVISIESGAYRKKMKELVGISSSLFKKICYVTVNDPYKTIASGIASGTKSEIFWIDCVTSTVKTPAAEKNVTFVSSPHALTEISIAIKKTIQKEGTDFSIFDSLSALLVYEQPPTVLKFIHNIVLTLREAELNACFVILKEDVKEELMKDLAMFVDMVVKLD